MTCQKTLSDIEFPYYHTFSMFVRLEIATVLLWVVAVSAVHLEIETPLMRRLKASPMFWLHIPKCGTSFANTVMHMPNVCPGLGENLSIDDEQFGKCFEHTLQKNCLRWCDQSLIHCNWPIQSHQFLSDEKYEEYKGKFVALLRQPEQRLLSAYNDDGDLFRAEPFISICAENRTPERILSLDEFKSKWAHWATGQIVGHLPATLADVPVALQRLREGFAFVGLQEEWDLSVCLFHTKFGGPCRNLEFLDTRPSDRATGNTSEYDTSILDGWVDEIDGPVYTEAQRLFYDDLKRYGVSHETCQACYQEANVA